MANPLLYELLRVSLPGCWIDHADRDHASTLRDLLDSAADQFNDAVVACQFYEQIAADDLKRDALSESLARRDPVRERFRRICARAYVYALDTTCSFVKTLVEQPLNAPTAIAACDAFLSRFREIRDIRNSLAHVDERSQGLGSRAKKLPGPVLMVGGAFMGNRFGITSGDGRYAEVEISERFLACLRSALLEIIWSFEWIVIGDIRAKRPEHTE